MSNGCCSQLEDPELDIRILQRYVEMIARLSEMLMSKRLPFPMRQNAESLVSGLLDAANDLLVMSRP